MSGHKQDVCQDQHHKSENSEQLMVEETTRTDGEKKVNNRSI